MHLVHLAHRIKVDAAVAEWRSQLAAGRWLPSFVLPSTQELRLRQLAPPVDPEIAAVRTCAAAACRHPQQQLPHPQPQREDRVGGAAEKPRRQDQDGASGARRDPRCQAKGGTASLSRCPYMPPLFLFVDHATAPLATAQPRRVREQQGTAPPRPETRNELPEDYFTTYAFLMYNLVSTAEDVTLLQEC